MNDFSISVIVPTYNRASCLRRAIQSVLKQSFLNWSLWIIDDASTDHTPEIIKEFGDVRIYSIRLPIRGGAPRARNAGIMASRSPYFTFLDSDDELAPQALEREYETLQRLPSSYGLVYTDMIKLYDTRDPSSIQSHEPTGKINRTICKPQKITPTQAHSPEYYSVREHQKHPASLFYPNLYHIPISWLVRRDVFQKVGLFDLSLKSHEDFELLIRISKSYKLYYLPEPQYIAHQLSEPGNLPSVIHHPGKKQNSKNTDHPFPNRVHSLENGIKGWVHILNCYRHTIEQDPRLKGSLLTFLSSYYKHLGGMPQAIRMLLQAFLTDRNRDRLHECFAIALNAFGYSLTNNPRINKVEV